MSRPTAASPKQTKIRNSLSLFPIKVKNIPNTPSNNLKFVKTKGPKFHSMQRKNV